MQVVKSFSIDFIVIVIAVVAVADAVCFRYIHDAIILRDFIFYGRSCHRLTDRGRCSTDQCRGFSFHHHAHNIALPGKFQWTEEKYCSLHRHTGLS